MIEFDDFDDDDDRIYSIHDPATGRPRRLERECATCIYRLGNLMDLKPGRLLDITNQARSNGSFVICHSTLRDSPAACRGFLNRFSTNLSRITERLGGYLDVPEPGKED